jgi:opacity protein-like surface antigen
MRNFCLTIAALIILLSNTAHAVEMLPYVGLNIAPMYSNDSKITQQNSVSQEKIALTLKRGIGVNVNGLMGLSFFDPSDTFTMLKFDVEVGYQYLPVRGNDTEARISEGMPLMGPNIYVGFPLPVDKTSGFLHFGYAAGLGQSDEGAYHKYKTGLGITWKLSKEVEVDAGYRFAYTKGDNNSDTRKFEMLNHELVLALRYLICNCGLFP